jgi:2-phospho-L-lactate transferase/gluconeogenesis factor (CofD/UPF0052 family)
LRFLFNHRLTDDSSAARLEWLDIIEARHSLWTNVSSARKELIRPFLNLLNVEIVKRARPTSVFNFARASIGNMFLTGARLFTGSLESSIELLTLVCGVPDNTRVLPAMNTNFTHHICAGLQDGSTIVGQNSISHPLAPTAVPDIGTVPASPAVDHDSVEDANLPGSLPSLRGTNIIFSKDVDVDLPSRIERLWYINPYGHEIRLAANSKVLEALRNAQCVVYSIGSLYTSLIPSLILKGIGDALLNSPSIKCKVLILNGTLDRETGPRSTPFTAVDFVEAIAQACWESLARPGQVPRTEFRRFVTHVLYLEGPDTPAVDKIELSAVGILCSKISSQSDASGKRLYDQVALREALAALVGGGAPRSRRNTLTEIGKVAVTMH